MATRKHSIVVPITMGAVADQNNTITTTGGTPTIYIPENSVGNPVTFSSVMVFIGLQDTSTATGASVSGFTSTLQLSGATTGQTVTLSTATLGNTGENWGGIFGPLDYTTHFNSDFGTGTSKRVIFSTRVGISTGTGTAVRGLYAYMEITYEYSDTEANRIQTICIPYESSTSTLTTTSGTTFMTIPQLSGATGLLSGYTSPTVRHRWIQIKGNCNNNNTTTDHNLFSLIDASGSTITLPTRESALGSDNYHIYLVDASSASITESHQYKLWGSLAARWANLIVNEWITFEYVVSGVTNPLNYIEIPIEFNSPIAGTTSGFTHLYSRTIHIPEPGTIITKNCAVELNYNTVSSATANVLVGSQAAYRAYAQSSNVVAGQFSLQHRFDSGSAAGNGLTLVRGENTINVKLFRSAGTMTNVTGIIRLLYSSEVSADGLDAHSHTCYGYIRGMTFTLTGDTLNTDSFSIPETNYYLQSLGINYHVWLAGTAATFTYFMTQAEILSSEANGAGWRELITDVYSSDGELGYSTWYAKALDNFKRYPRDQERDRLDVETSRRYRSIFTTTAIFGMRWVTCYHSITHTVSGTISGSAGGVVDLDLYETTSDGRHLIYDSTTVTGNSAYSFTVYEDLNNFFVSAYESSTLKGRSYKGVPSTDFDINLAGGSSAVTTGYASG